MADVQTAIIVPVDGSDKFEIRTGGAILDWLDTADHDQADSALASEGFTRVTDWKAQGQGAFSADIVWE